MSCLSISYDRPSYTDSRKRKGKRHCKFIISWKGNNMGMITALLMVGTGVYGRSTITKLREQECYNRNTP